MTPDLVADAVSITFVAGLVLWLLFFVGGNL